MIEQLTRELELFFDELPQQSQLLSITLPFHQRPFTAPLLPQEGIYWHNGTNRTRKLAFGCAWSTTTSGADRFTTCHQQLQAITPHWIHLDPEAYGEPPQLFLQYAFDEQDSMEQGWEDFPNCRLHLPRLQLSNQQGRQWLTFSHTLEGMSQPLLLQQWLDDLQQLQQLIDRPATATSSVQLHSIHTDAAPIQPAIDATQAGELEKVVVARRDQLHSDHPIELHSPLQQLEQRHPQGVQLTIHSAESTFFAAPPEKLLLKSAERIETEALAGTVPRGRNEAEDQQFQQELRDSPKLQQEHQMVVDFIQQQLAPYCTAPAATSPPTIHKLDHIQHLQTPIQGQLNTSVSIFELINALHQSPAICGTPRKTALNWLRSNHNSQRGYYCGGAGWIDPEGNGEIQVLLRCGLVQGDSLSLHAGAGIIHDSDLQSEQNEIEIKIESIIQAFTP